MAAQITLVRLRGALALLVHAIRVDRAVETLTELQVEAVAGDAPSHLPVAALLATAEVAKSILRLGQGPVLALREGPRLV